MQLVDFPLGMLRLPPILGKLIKLSPYDEQRSTWRKVSGTNYLDMLARLGVGNAHPGGFAGTLEMLEKFPIPKGSKVLEVGCGTGRTACYLAQQGYCVTAVDIRPTMISKARNRAAVENLSVDFQVGDVCALPFDANSFDLVLAESVTIFVSVPLALKEYSRVLQSGGKLYDREITATKPYSNEVAAAVQDFYGVEELYQVKDWEHMLKLNGFHDLNIVLEREFPLDMWKDEMEHPDPMQQTDIDVYSDSHIWDSARRYNQIMTDYRAYFGYAQLIAVKEEGA